MAHHHTPGPWMWSGMTLHPVVRDPATSNVHSILDAEGGFGYLGSKASDTLAELDANYALIAKAPMLLEALDRLHRRGHLNENTCADDATNADLRFAAAALASAKGGAA